MSEEAILPGTRELIPVRMLNEFSFCPRLAYIEWVQGDFIDNEHTLQGTRRHKTVTEEKGDISDIEDKNIRARGITLSSDKLGIISKMDIVDGENGEVSPLELKKGDSPDEGVWEADLVQIGSQMIILRDNDLECHKGYVYYSATNKKVLVPFDEMLESKVIDIVNRIRNCAEKGEIPEPLNASKKCEGCSIAGICLPDETILLSNISGEKDIRCLYAAKDDENPLVINEQGSYLSKSGEELVLRKEGGKIGSIRIMEVSDISLYGNVQISTQALAELIDRNIPVSYFSYGGWFRGLTLGMPHKNVELRIKQYQAYGDDKRRLDFARMFVNGKIRNCRTLLMRNGEDIKLVCTTEMKRLADKALRCKNEESLLGIEGAGARLYFLSFPKLLKNGFKGVFEFKQRNRRPPKDPINAMLSFAYSLLSKDLTIAALKVGFDPYLGFYHKPRYGRPALALDIMEEFRPIVADSTVISAVNNEEVKQTDFIMRNLGVTMSPEARKGFTYAYERRMRTEIKHPIFGYQVSYRRVLELQMRIMARCLTGEIDNYIPFTTR